MSIGPADHRSFDLKYQMIGPITPHARRDALHSLQRELDSLSRSPDAAARSAGYGSDSGGYQNEGIRLRTRAGGTTGGVSGTDYGMKCL